MNLNIVVYSNLDASNGGVETWLRLFINEVNRERTYFSGINIYFRHTPGEDVQLIETDHNLVNYCPVNLSGNKRNLLSNFLTLAKFHYVSIKKIKASGQFIVISIGSYPSGIFNWLILKILNYRKKVLHFIWLRTTLSKHIKTHNSRIFAKLIFLCEKMALKNTDVVIANGWDTRENYIKEYGINSEVIPNAIQLEKYKDVQPVSTLARDKIRIAFIGRFYDSKGVFNFINAIKIFNGHYSALPHKVQFIFIGWGERTVEEFARTEDNCELIGRIPNDKMLDMLCTIHCGVALTKSNKVDAGGSGISNNLLELMAAGKMIIAYDNIIYRQFPRNDFLLYVEENNDKLLAESFAEIVRSFDKYLPMAQKAKEYASSFSIENHVRSLQNVIGSVIE